MTMRLFSSFLLCLFVCLSACSKTEEEKKQELLFENDDPSFLDQIENIKKRGEHWLREASWQGKYKVAEALLQKGVNVNCKTDIRRTPLHHAVGDVKMMELLLKHGAKINAEADLDVHTNTWQKHTPLHFAAGSGQLEGVQFLVEHGAKLDAKDYENRTPLLEAVRKGSYPVAEYLISKGANVNIQGENFDHPTPLHEACRHQNKKIISLLIEHGADLHAKNKKGETPYEYCLHNYRKNLAEILKKAEEEQEAKKQKKS